MSPKQTHINPAPAGSPEPRSVPSPETAKQTEDQNDRASSSVASPLRAPKAQGETERAATRENEPRVRLAQSAGLPTFAPEPSPVEGAQKGRRHSPFRFKQFAVMQERAAMKIGTDGVLLGAWVSLPETRGIHNILDVGTGTGVIALMLAQRTAADTDPCVIDAVEVEPEAAAEAQANFDASPWRSRLAAHALPVQQYAAQIAAATTPQKYDLIVSNPPYFIAGLDFRRGIDTSEGATRPSAARVAARHAEQLPYDELIDAILLLMKPDTGRFAAIFPYQESGIFIAKAAGRGLFVTRTLDVHGAAHKPVKRVAVEFSLRRPDKKEDIVRESLSIEDSAGNFTEAYRELTRDFYLKF